MKAPSNPDPRAGPRSGSRPPRAQSVQGKPLIVGLLVGVVLVAGLLFWIGVSGGSRHVPQSRPGVGFTVDNPGAATSAPGAASAAAPALAWDGGVVGQTVRDPRVRDELRRRILAGWAASDEPEVAAAARQGRFVPARAGDGGASMDPRYIQEVIRGDLMPMAKHCYEELLSRKKGAKGRIEMSFTIVADESLGAIVEDVGVGSDGGLADEKMTTCMRESISTLAFRPPAEGGYVTVVYPIELSDDDDDDRDR